MTIQELIDQLQTFIEQGCPPHTVIQADVFDDEDDFFSRTNIRLDASPYLALNIYKDVENDDVLES